MSGLDISDVLATERAAVRHLEREIPREMKRILDAAAREEVHTHVYNNYTHRLEKSTFASEPVVTGDRVTIEYGARMEYASNVVGRGRSRVDELGDKAAVELEFFFDGASF